MIHIQPVIGLAVLIAVAWGLSEDRGCWSTRLVLAGVATQLLVALVALNVPPIRDAVQALNGVVLALDAATKAGTGLVFGYLGGGRCRSRNHTQAPPSSLPSRPCRSCCSCRRCRRCSGTGGYCRR